MQREMRLRTSPLTRRQSRDVSSLVSIRAIAFTAIAPHINLHSTPRHSTAIFLFVFSCFVCAVAEKFPILLQHKSRRNREQKHNLIRAEMSMSDSVLCAAMNFSPFIFWLVVVPLSVTTFSRLIQKRWWYFHYFSIIELRWCWCVSTCAETMMILMTNEPEWT
jgi:hypothetical protein